MLHAPKSEFSNTGSSRAFRPGQIRTPPPGRLFTDWSWLEDFVAERGELGARQFSAWEKRRGGGPDWTSRLAEFKSMEHRILYSLTVEDVLKAARATKHALGGVKREEAKFRGINNFSPPVPMVYIFHRLLEESGRVPLWEDVKRYVLLTRPKLMWGPFRQEYGLGPGHPEARPDSDTMRAFQWRLGAAYYSWLREVHMLTVLRREHRFDLRYHFLADAEWKADFVGGRVLVELYLKNGDYKGDSGGRKVLCRQMNPDPAFSVVQVTLETENIGGVVWLVSRATIDDAAEKLAAAGCSRII